MGCPSGPKGSDDVSKPTLNEGSQIQAPLILKWLESRRYLVRGEKAHRYCQGFNNIFDPTFAQYNVEESGINKPLTSSKQGSKEQDLKYEANHVHDRIGNESDGSNRQMDQLDGSPRVKL